MLDRNRPVRRILMQLLLGICLSGMAQGGVVAPDTVVGGRTMSEWSALWWIWGFSFPIPGPLDDTTGEFGHLGNDGGGGVFFIGGGSNNFPVYLNMTVPAGHHIFFPLTTVVEWIEPGRVDTDEDLITAIDLYGADQTGHFATIDGIAIPNLLLYRVRSPFFEFHSPEGGFLPEGIYRGLADGVYLMLEPMTGGPHTLHFGGAFPIFDFAADTTVTFSVAPEPSTWAMLSLAAVAALFRRRRSLLSGRPLESGTAIRPRSHLDR